MRAPVFSEHCSVLTHVCVCEWDVDAHAVEAYLQQIVT